MSIILWTLIAFISGSIPFSVWLGYLFIRKDIRQYGDHNPGATNALRAGGWQIGMIALILDIAKGAAPVGAAWYWGGLAGWELVPVALAPVLGHAFSPFLKFRGGKAIAVTGGIWAALSLGEGIIVAAALLVLWYAIVDVDGWAVMLGMFSFFAYLILTGNPTPLLVIWVGNVLVLAWKHRQDLALIPHLRPWLRRSAR